jgi:hypothetical protein
MECAYILCTFFVILIWMLVYFRYKSVLMKLVTLQITLIEEEFFLQIHQMFLSIMYSDFDFELNVFTRGC